MRPIAYAQDFLLRSSDEHYGSAFSLLTWKNTDEAEPLFSLPGDSHAKCINCSKHPKLAWARRTQEMIGEHDMPLSTVLITLVAAGLLLWIVNRFIPMQSQIKSILNGVVVIVLVLWIANLYGVFGHLHQFRVGR